jgi:Cytochrome P460
MDELAASATADTLAGSATPMVAHLGRMIMLNTSLFSTARAVLAPSTAAGVAVAVAIACLNETAFSADKYAVKVPDGLAFSEFRGFEDWAAVGVSQARDLIEVIVANPVMIKAYRAGVPGNGKPFPDGSKMAKIHWTTKKGTEPGNTATMPDTLHDIDFMVRDSKRFSKTGNWGYAQFDYDAASDTFKPNGTGSGCGYACHTGVKDKDYVFTAYGKR